MRILLTSRGSSGHLTPLAPFARAALRAGHQVLAVVQDVHAGNARRLGLEVATVASAPPEVWGPRLAAMTRLGFEDANRAMLTEYFGRLDTEHALPGLRRIVEEWRPDVILRESWEFASTIAGELHGVPLVRGGLALASVEAYGDELLPAVLDEIRAGVGLPPDPEGRALRQTPYLTMVPAALDGPGAPVLPFTHRHRHETGGQLPALPRSWWRGAGDAPLVYVSFGSVSGSAHMPYFPALYRAAIDAIAPFGARVLVTVGEEADPAALGPLPDNVRAERWVPQDAVLAEAAAVVMHGGFGSTLGALAHGVPAVVVPLFSYDQWANAAALARAGAGIALDADAQARRVLDMPADEVLAGLPAAVEHVLGDASYGDAARAIADEMAALPAAGAALDTLLAAAA